MELTRFYGNPLIVLFYELITVLLCVYMFTQMILYFICVYLCIISVAAKK